MIFILVIYIGYFKTYNWTDAWPHICVVAQAQARCSITQKIHIDLSASFIRSFDLVMVKCERNPSMIKAIDPSIDRKPYRQPLVPPTVEAMHYIHYIYIHDHHLHIDGADTIQGRVKKIRGSRGIVYRNVNMTQGWGWLRLPHLRWWKQNISSQHFYNKNSISLHTKISRDITKKINIYQAMLFVMNPPRDHFVWYKTQQHTTQRA